MPRTARIRGSLPTIGSTFAAFVTLVALLCGPERAAAQVRCPHADRDACDQWHFEQIDQDLTQVIVAAVEKIERFAHPDARQEAKDALAESHRAFVVSREADCRAEAAFMWLRTARSRESYTAACMFFLTEGRIARLKQRYLLP
jgi:uncharacterized protein YecT (DUF1311 family)